jgi:hypothetical protein
MLWLSGRAPTILKTGVRQSLLFLLFAGLEYMYFKNAEILEPLKSWFLISPRAILYTKMGLIFKGFRFRP